MNNELINCGERNLQKLFRISIMDICERYGLKEGECVEVYIKPKKIVIDSDVET